MADREKVIEELINVKEHLEMEGHYFAKTVSDVLELLKEQEHKDRMFHALEEDWKRLKELLKEQEAVKPHYNARTNWYECENCHYSMTSGMHCRGELIPAYKVGYCAKCGRGQKWE